MKLLLKKYCVLLIMTSHFFSCQFVEPKEINLVKQHTIQIESNEYITVENICKKLAGLKGRVDWKIINTKDLKIKALATNFPHTKIVNATIFRSENVEYGHLVFLINTNTDLVEFLAGELGDSDEFWGDNALMVSEIIKIELLRLNYDEEYIKKFDNLNNFQSSLKAGDICFVTVDKLNLRSSPSVDENIVGIINKDAKIKIIEIVNDDWVKIDLENGEGYVSTKYLKRVSGNSQEKIGNNRFKFFSSSKEKAIENNLNEKKVTVRKESEENELSQIDLNHIEEEDFRQADAELNLVYQQILNDYKSDTIFIQNLKKAQRIWISFRDAELKMKYPDREPYYYGSLHSMCISSYLTKLTRERIKTLKVWIEGIEEGDVCIGSVKRK